MTKMPKGWIICKALELQRLKSFSYKKIQDKFSEQYMDYLDGTYDSIDRIVLNAYFRIGLSPGGFRFWWRMLIGNDDNLNNSQLMRFAGRFSRRIHTSAKNHGVPLIHCQAKERKHKIAEPYFPTIQIFEVLFAYLSVRHLPLFLISNSLTTVEWISAEKFLKRLYKK